MTDESLEREKDDKMNPILDWMVSIIIAIIIAMIIKTFLFEPTRIEGSSMNMTLQTHDRVIVDKIGMKISQLERGDIIVMKYDETHDYIKRIVGLPGDIIQIIDGKVYLNGELFDEPYIFGDYTDIINGFEWKLGQDEYFVMGDNRQPAGSTDSRVFGPITLDRIKGVAKFRFWPLNNIGFIE